MDTKVKELIDQATVILREFGASEIYIFGSATRDDYDAERSDIDIAVRGIPPRDFFSAVGETLCSIGKEIDIIDLDAKTSFGEFLVKHGELTRVF